MKDEQVDHDCCGCREELLELFEEQIKVLEKSNREQLKIIGKQADELNKLKRKCQCGVRL